MTAGSLFARARSLGGAVVDFVRETHSLVKILIGIPLLLILVYIAVFFFQYRIDDDSDLAANPRFAVQGGSEAVTMVSTLMYHETHETTWAPNQLWFWPIAHSTNMVNYQIGIQAAVARWGVEMSDFLGRERGSGAADNDLNDAAGLLKYDPTAWLLPSAVTQYDKALKDLTAYNQRLAKGEAKYDKISSNLSVFLDRISKDLGSQSNTLELTILTPSDYSQEQKDDLTDNAKALLSSNGGYFDHRATQIFFETKGRLYADYIILKAIGDDFHDVLVVKNADKHWDNMLLSLRAAATYHKFFVANGAAGSLLVPNDLTAQGFHLLRADKQMQELIDILK